MRVVKTLLFIYVAVGALLFFFQRTFIYFPTPNVKHSFSEIGYDINGSTIKVVYANRDKKQAILYFGGNAEAVEFNTPEYKELFPEYAIFLVKYRGYGGSQGKPTEDNLYLDALRIFDELKKDYSDIVVVGRSLGSGVATYVASKRNIKKLILITPYDSIQSVAQEQYPIYPMSILLKDKYNSLGRVGSISVKTLLLIAQNDKTITRHHSNNLAKAFKQTTPSVIVIPDTNHNTIAYSSKYKYELKRFINSNLN